MKKRWHMGFGLLLLLFFQTKAQTVKPTTMALPAQTLSITVLRPADDVYAYLSAPANFAIWAEGFGSQLAPTDTPGTWHFKMANGNNATAKFTPPNPFRIVDHYVYPGNGQEVFVPMRVVANGAGSEVLFTLFRQPDMTNEMLAKDKAAVLKDLGNLKKVLEQR
ncbi:SRPBCC family protein [Chitinophaga sp. G-6-1-13]|uniref:SRPBCC family protein n=1 Tax=Chitinophaga fulva TaxID=2728842 RepID=A0A848GMS6_9BACT|nr:SRPBCC family protein [Chitinophaga fulva]NML39736.1 SRPBCC family protein [Chitinophaga fulva]